MGEMMKYIFSASCSLKQGKRLAINDVYHRLCEKFSEVTVYHRACRKKPLFGDNVTVISDCPACRERYSYLPGVRVISVEEALS